MLGYYQHYRGRGFEENAAGPIVKKGNVVVDLSTNKDEYNLEQKSSIERNIPVGVWVTKPGVKSTALKEIAATDVFESASITIRVGTEEVYKNLYLYQILEANQNGHPYYLEFHTRVNLSESSIKVNDSAAILANTCLELQFDYLKKAQ